MTNITLNINLEEGEELVKHVETYKVMGTYDDNDFTAKFTNNGVDNLKTVTTTTIKKVRQPRKALEESTADIPSAWYGTL